MKAGSGNETMFGVANTYYFLMNNVVAINHLPNVIMNNINGTMVHWVKTLNEHAPYKRGMARSHNGRRTFKKNTIKWLP